MDLRYLFIIIQKLNLINNTLNSINFDSSYQQALNRASNIIHSIPNQIENKPKNRIETPIEVRKATPIDNLEVQRKKRRFYPIRPKESKVCLNVGRSF